MIIKTTRAGHHRPIGGQVFYQGGLAASVRTNDANQAGSELIIQTSSDFLPSSANSSSIALKLHLSACRANLQVLKLGKQCKNTAKKVKSKSGSELMQDCRQDKYRFGLHMKTSWPS